MSDWLPIVVSVAALLVTSIIFWLGRRRSVKVTCEQGVGLPAFLGSPAPETLEIVAVSKGRSPVTIEAAGFICNNEKDLIEAEWHISGLLPVELTYGQSVRLSILYERLVALLMRQGEGVLLQSAFVRDTLKREYKTKLPQYVVARGIVRRTWRDWLREL